LFSTGIRAATAALSLPSTARTSVYRCPVVSAWCAIYPERIRSKECALTRSMNAKFERISMDLAKSRADRFRRNPPISAAGLALRVHTSIADRAHTRGFRANSPKCTEMERLDGEAEWIRTSGTADGRS
jgi:hypothetical protein